MSTPPTLVSVPDRDALAAAAAAAVARLLRSAVSDRGVASLVLTGGGAGIATLRALVDTDVDWRRVEIYFGDERHLPSGDPERNEVQATEAFLSRISPAAVHVIPADDETPIGEVAAAYERILPASGFDVHLLGMGGEGHINSLFPDTPEVAETHRRVLSVTDSPKPPSRRITLTLPAVNSADHVVFLVAGADKATAVASLLSGADPAALPAAGARGRISTVLYADEAALGR